jgi:hypothetical protein
MRYDNNPFEELALRVRRGEPGAVELLRREATPPLTGLVRTALRKHAGFNVFEKRARAVAVKLQQASAAPLPWRELTRQTADRLCDEFIGELQAGCRPRDTIMFATESCRFETVAAG